MKTVMLIVLLALTSLSFVMAEEDIKVYQITSDEQGFWEGLFALVPDKYTYDPSDGVGLLTVASAAPCNAHTAILTMEHVDGGVSFYQDVTDLTWFCSTTNYQVWFGIPSREGQYEIELTFFDGDNILLYVDRTYITVSSGPVACPANYCENWEPIGNVNNGHLETKTCFLYDSGTCDVDAEISTRLVCDAGFKENPSLAFCESDKGPVCGDHVLQVGEQCDDGNGNGVCPNRCNLACDFTDCEAIPDFEENPPPGGEGGAGNKGGIEKPPSPPFTIGLILAGIASLLLIIVGIVMVGGARS